MKLNYWIGITLNFLFHQTQMDLKALNIFYDNLSTTTYLYCEYSQSRFNDEMEFVITNTDILEKGIRPLRMHIDCMQFLIQVGMKSEVQVDRCRRDELEVEARTN